MYDVAIIGTGPAGLSAGIAAGRAGLSTVMFEKEGIGGELVNRDSVKNYPGFPDGIAGPELRSTLVSTLEKYDPKAILTTVEEINPGSPHTIHTPEDVYEASSVIIATGGRDKHLDVPGEEDYRGRGVFYCAKCDGPLYQGETLAVIGGTEHALIDTQFLAGLTDKVIVLSSESTLPAGQEVRTTVEENQSVEIHRNTEVLEILGTDGLVDGLRVAQVDGSDERTIDIGGLYAYVGIEPNTEFLDGTVSLSDTGQVDVGADMQTDVAGIYAAGDVRSGSPQMIPAAIGDGTVAIESIRQFLES